MWPIAPGFSVQKKVDESWPSPKMAELRENYPHVAEAVAIQRLQRMGLTPSALEHRFQVSEERAQEIAADVRRAFRAAESETRQFCRRLDEQSTLRALPAPTERRRVLEVERRHQEKWHFDARALWAEFKAIVSEAMEDLRHG